MKPGAQPSSAFSIMAGHLSAKRSYETHNSSNEMSSNGKGNHSKVIHQIPSSLPKPWVAWLPSASPSLLSLSPLYCARATLLLALWEDTVAFSTSKLSSCSWHTQLPHGWWLFLIHQLSEVSLTPRLAQVLQVQNLLIPPIFFFYNTPWSLLLKSSWHDYLSIIWTHARM